MKVELDIFKNIADKIIADDGMEFWVVFCTAFADDKYFLGKHTHTDGSMQVDAGIETYNVYPLSSYDPIEIGNYWKGLVSNG